MKENEFIIKEVKDNSNYNIELQFCENKMNLLINSDYDSFLSEICKLININKENAKSVILKYIDDDEDTITISNSGDYEIFISQVKDNLVNKLEIKIKENSDLDTDQCLANFLNCADFQDEKSNNIKQNNNNINENEINNMEEIIIKQRKDSDNNEDNISENEIILQNDNKLIIQEDNEINNEPNFINNYFNDNDNNKTVFDCECSSCNKFPITGVMFLCQECDINLCQECMQNANNHIHQMTKIETEEELIQHLEKAFEIIEKKEKDQEIQEIREIHQIQEVNEIQETNQEEDKKKSYFGFSKLKKIPKWIKNYWTKKKK